MHRSTLRPVAATLLAAFLIPACGGNQPPIRAIPTSERQVFLVKSYDAAGEEIDAELVIRPQERTMALRGMGISGDPVRFDDVTSATYALAKKPRWGAGVAAALVLAPVALLFALWKKKRHWLTVTTAEVGWTLRLEKDNYRQVVGMLDYALPEGVVTAQ